MDLKHSENLKHWDMWKETLKKAVNLGEAVGMSEETIDKLAAKIGSFLSAAVDPENDEQRLLQKLWKLADDDERLVLAKLIVKLVQQ